MELNFDEFIRRVLVALENAEFFDKDELAKSIGLDRASFETALREYFFGKSFAVRAYPNYSRLGLKSVTAFLDFSFKWVEQAPDTLDMLSRNGFLVSWIKPFGGYTYVTHHAVPPDFVAKYRALFDQLVELGLLSGYRFYEFESQPEGFAYDPAAYDYRQARWKERANLGVEISRSLKGLARQPFEGLDEIDLQIIEQLQHTSLQSLDALAKAIQQPLEVVETHMRDHVIKQKLVLKYLMDIFRGEYIAPETAALVGFCEGMREEVGSELEGWLLKHPYLTYINPGGDKVEFHLEMPWRVVPFMTTLLDKKVFALKPATYYLGVMSLASLHTYTIPLQQFSGGKWYFDDVATFESFKLYLEASAQGQS